MRSPAGIGAGDQDTCAAGRWCWINGNRHRCHIAWRRTVASPIGKAVAAAETRIGRVAERAIGVESHDAVGSSTDETGRQGTLFHVRGAANGIVTLNSDGSFSYTPNPGFSGSD